VSLSLPGATGFFGVAPNGQLLNPDVPVFLDNDGTRILIRG